MRDVVGFLGRLLAASVGVAVLTLLTLSFVRLIGEDLAFYRRLHALQTEVAVLRARANSDERTIQRISDDRGAIPEIHDRLHVVGPHESIIYLKHSGGSPTSRPAPGFSEAESIKRAPH